MQITSITKHETNVICFNNQERYVCRGAVAAIQVLECAAVIVDYPVQAFSLIPCWAFDGHRIGHTFIINY